MNPNHWSSYTEAELAHMRAGHTLRASRPGHGARHRAPQPVAAPDVTADARQFLDGLHDRVPADPGPAYPAEWLPEIKATQTPVDWMNENAPDPHLQRNGTPPASVPADDAYPAEWLQGFGGLGGGALGGEGFLTRREVVMKVAVTSGPGALQASLAVTLDAEQPQPLRVDWGDGAGLATLPSGTTTAVKTYSKAGFYKVVVQGNDVRATETVRVGSPAIPVYDQAKNKERREATADELAGLAGTKGLVG